MTPELSAKISNYVLTHGLSFKPQSEVLSDMLKSGVITKAEYDEAINGNIFSLSDTPQASVSDDVIITNPPMQRTTSSNHTAKHPVLNFLSLNSIGQIDMNQFSMESLKAKYPEKDFEIVEDKSDENSVMIGVFNKSTHTLVYSQTVKQYETGHKEYFISLYNKNTLTQGVIVADGMIKETITGNPDGSMQSYRYQNGDLSQITQRCDMKPDGSSTVMKYKNSKLSTKTNFDKDNKFVDGYVYADGRVYGECNEYDNITKNYITDEIIKCLESDDPQKIEKLTQIITEKVTPATIEDVYDSFYEQTGKNLVDAISMIKGINPKQFFNIYTELSFTKQNVLGTDNDVADTSRRLYLYHVLGQTDKFKETVLSITPENAYEVQSAFGSDDAIGDSFKQESLASLNELMNLSKMSEEDKKECRKHLVDTLIKSYEDRKLYVADIKEDILSHLDDPKKFEVDYKRLISRGGSEPSDEEISEPNGEIDLDVVQGNIGDCWLIAGIKNLGHKKSGKEFLKNMLSVDKEKRTITVTFPAVSKSYTITFDEINKSNHLATGDGDARAIEIAVDRYIKEYAYSDIDMLTEDLMKSEHADNVATTMMIDDYDDNAVKDRYDLNADHTQFFYKLLFGDGEIMENIDMESSDFNNDNTLFSFGINEANAVMAYNSEENTYIYLEDSHAYIIDSSDDKYIYLIDPREEGYNPLRVERKDLANIRVDVEMTDIE